MHRVPAPPRLADILAGQGLAAEVYEFDESTRTAQEAAAAIGCVVAEIGKSLVFTGKESGRCVVVVASGVDRIDEARLGDAFGEPVRKATADEVRSATGYAIGGVPPFGHATPLPVLVDANLARLDDIWVAAGTPRTVLPIATSRLIRIAQATVAAVAAG